MLQSSPSRELQLRTRSDLLFSPREDSGCVVVKDPLSLQYHLLSEEEYALLTMLRQPTSIQRLKGELEHLFFPQTTSVGELTLALGMLHRRGLLSSRHEGQGEQFWWKEQRGRRRKWIGRINPLFIRLPGIDPDPFLGWLYPKLQWLFSPVTAFCGFTIVLLSVLAMLSQADSWQSRTPAVSSMLDLTQLPLLLLAVAFAKVLHELAHGLACKHFGGEVHEMGLALFLLTPCLYCDTSDSWMLPRRQHRMLIAAAGMIVEVCLASVAGIAWCLLSEGIVRDQCFYILIACSVSTLAFNLNPLLRYDGYYILADWLNTANLWARSRAVVTGLAIRLTTGVAAPVEHGLPATAILGLLCYGLLSIVYRWFVLGVALWFIYRIASAHDVPAFGVGFCLVVGVISMVAAVRPPLQFFSVPGRLAAVRGMRVGLSGVLLGGVLLAVCYLPLPIRISAIAVVSPSDDALVFAQTTGILTKSHVVEGQAVAQGQLLVELQNEELEERAASMASRIAQVELQLQNLRRQQSLSEVAAAQLTTMTRLLEQLTQQREVIASELSLLKITAPSTGRVMLAASHGQQPMKRSTKMSTKESTDIADGFPTDAQNQGCIIKPGEVVCRIFDPDNLEITAQVEQRSIEFVQSGFPATIRLEGLAGHLLRGHVVSISSSPVNGSSEPAAENKFDVRIHLDQTADTDLQQIAVKEGMQGLVRIHSQPRSMMFLMRKWIRELFKI